LVLLKVEDAGVKETIQTHEGWDNTFNDQFSWIINCCFTSANLKTKTNAIALSHKLECITLGQWTAADLVNNLLILDTELVNFNSGFKVLQFLVIALENSIVLDGSFVKFLLSALLSNSFICTVIQLCNYGV